MIERLLLRKASDDPPFAKTVTGILPIQGRGGQEWKLAIVPFDFSGWNPAKPFRWSP
jgi:hypothetical protein